MKGRCGFLTSLGAALWAGLAQPVLALECVGGPDLATQFKAAAAAPETYAAVLGVFTFDESLQPGDGTRTPDTPPDPIPGRFVGKGLTGDGFSLDLDQPVLIQPVCAGPWCGSMGSNQTVLAFVRMQGNGYVLDVLPCNGLWVFSPDAANIALVTACFRGDACDPRPPQP